MLMGFCVRGCPLIQAESKHFLFEIGFCAEPLACMGREGDVSRVVHVSLARSSGHLALIVGKVHFALISNSGKLLGLFLYLRANHLHCCIVEKLMNMISEASSFSAGMDFFSAPVKH